MAGEEIVAAKAAMGVASSVSRKLRGDPAITAALIEDAKNTPEYKMAVSSTVKKLAIRRHLVLKLYEPIGLILGFGREYFTHQFPEDMAKKTEGIPTEDLITPRPATAVPTMQGLSLVLEEPDLKEMFLNLLAAASDSQREAEAHPSFAQFIRELLPQEAALLRATLDRIAGNNVMPIAQLRAQVAPPSIGYAVRYNHLVDWRNNSGEMEEQPLFPMFIDNWVRLGIIETDYSNRVAGDRMYDWVADRPEYKREKESVLSNPRFSSLVFHKGLIRLTEFGLRFDRAISTPPVRVVSEPDSDDDSASPVPPE